MWLYVSNSRMYTLILSSWHEKITFCFWKMYLRNQKYSTIHLSGYEYKWYGINMVYLTCNKPGISKKILYTTLHKGLIFCSCMVCCKWETMYNWFKGKDMALHDMTRNHCLLHINVCESYCYLLENIHKNDLLLITHDISSTKEILTLPFSNVIYWYW